MFKIYLPKFFHMTCSVISSYKTQMYIVFSVLLVSKVHYTTFLGGAQKPSRRMLVSQLYCRHFHYLLRKIDFRLFSGRTCEKLVLKRDERTNNCMICWVFFLFYATQHYQAIVQLLEIQEYNLTHPNFFDSFHFYGIIHLMLCLY